MRKIVCVLSMLIGILPIFAESKDLSVRISIFKQNFTGDEPLRVSMFIFNTGNQEQSFSLSDNLYQSLSFDLRTTANESVELKPAVDARMRTVYSNPELYRRITLAPGEAFTRIYDLREYFDIRNDGAYYVRGRFYPDPDNREDVGVSEYASFTHAPPEPVRRRIEQKADIRRQGLEEAQKMLPNEVIQDLFEAQMVKDWERFLIHVDDERLINAFNAYADQYNNSQDGAFKLDILEKFRRFLTIHWNIPLTGYEIKETRIEGSTAEVTADALETVRVAKRRVRYNFNLYRNGRGQWLIENYTVLAVN